MTTLEFPQVLILPGIAMVVTIWIVQWKTNPLRTIPTVGGLDTPGLSILAWLNVLRRGKDLIQEGYQKYHGSAFKIDLFDRWLVVVSGSNMVDELTRRPDNEVSSLEGIEEVVHMKYTVDPEALSNPYHVHIIKEKLTRMLPTVFPDITEELAMSVQAYIPTQGDKWTPVNAMTTMQKIIVRTSNRAFVGLPLCRNEEYLVLPLCFTLDAMKDTVIMSITPPFLERIVGRMVSNARRTMAQAMKHIQPVIKERRAALNALGEDWSDKPNDVLQWIIDEAIRRDDSDANIVERIFFVNFAAIHTSSATTTHVLYDLAATPKCIQPLREEIEGVVATDGWSKAAVAKMRKLDSLFRESSRYHGISLVGLTRKAVKDITLNDGTFIPKGTVLAAAAGPTHHDEEKYTNATEFDPFRFERMRHGEGEGLKHQFVNTSVEFMPFGHGKHACPGRFFASSELKALIAYIILNYDLKLGGNGKRPPNLYYGTNILPSATGQVFFRKRQANAS